MEYLATKTEMQRIDATSIEEIKIPGMLLMERAALCMAHIIEKRFDKSAKVCIVAGVGNNGGDGLALGRMLLENGYCVDIQIVGNLEKASNSFHEQKMILENLGYSFTTKVDYEDYDILVDGIFGVGLARKVTGIYEQVIEQMKKAKAYKIAIDVPSGICASTGKVLGTALNCDLTITFGLNKRGLVLYPGADYAKEVIVADIGFPKKVVDLLQPTAITYSKEDLCRLPKRKNDSNKGTYGRVLIVAGTKNMAGACYFSAKAAYLCGCGLVDILTAEENRVILQGLIPEAVMSTYTNKEEALQLLEEKMPLCNTAVLGPGLGRNELTRMFLDKMLREYTGNLIVDADACNEWKIYEDLLATKKAKIVVTPHVKEASRMLNLEISTLKEDPIPHIYEYAKKNDLIFVLKDARTIISSGERLTFINSSGNNGMSTGGSGDVLTGIIAGLCSGGLSLEEASRLGVYCHGLCGDLARDEKGAYSVMAGDLLNYIPEVLGAK